jgi:hypothetical protein
MNKHGTDIIADQLIINLAELEAMHPMERVDNPAVVVSSNCWLLLSDETTSWVAASKRSNAMRSPVSDKIRTPEALWEGLKRVGITQRTTRQSFPRYAHQSSATFRCWLPRSGSNFRQLGVRELGGAYP